MRTAQWRMSSVIGPIFLVASEKGLQYATWERQASPMAKSLEGEAPEIRLITQAVRELEGYFAGKRKEFEVPLDVKGTAFQEMIWKRLSAIPYGETVSYKEVAGPGSGFGTVRAVGSANAKNPVCIIIPCHRVIASDGSLRGYSGGIEAKSRLLRLEGASFPKI